MNSVYSIIPSADVDANRDKVKLYVFSLFFPRNRKIDYKNMY